MEGLLALAPQGKIPYDSKRHIIMDKQFGNFVKPQHSIMLFIINYCLLNRGRKSKVISKVILNPMSKTLLNIEPLSY